MKYQIQKFNITNYQQKVDSLLWELFSDIPENNQITHNLFVILHVRQSYLGYKSP